MKRPIYLLFRHPACFALAAFVFAYPALAGTFTWQGDTSGDFNEPANWVEPAWAQWQEYAFDSNSVNGAITVDSFFGWGNLHLNNGLATDIVIGGTEPIIMAVDKIGPWGLPGPTGTINLAAAGRDLTINTHYFSAGAVTWNVGTDRTLKLTGSLQDWNGAAALVKSGNGSAVLTAANSYTGLTVIEGGVLNATTFPDYGVAGSLGNRASDSGPGNVGILFRGGTLQYTGTTPQATNRAIRISTTGGATIDASGSDPAATLSFTTPSSPDFFENPGNRTLTLTGTNPGDNTFAMAIGEAGGKTTLVKDGTGKWILTGANTHTGDTLITGGTLVLADDAQLTFVVTDTPASNMVTGTGTATFNGDFLIPTDGFPGITGYIWLLVDLAKLDPATTFGPTFSVSGFTPDPDGITWRKSGGTGRQWIFSEATGELTYNNDYGNWAGMYSLTGGEHDDDDHDGLTNMAEYAFGLIPNSGASVDPIAMPLDRASGRFRYTRRDPGLETYLNYTIWTSTDLAAWTEDPGASPSVISNVDEVETIEISLSAALLTNPKLFIQVRAK